MENEKPKSFLQSKKTNRIMTGILIIAIVICVFHLGEEFGYKKAQVMGEMGGGYDRAFGPKDPHEAGPFGYLFDDQTGTHGVAGKVISITDDKLLVEDHDSTEKTVIIDNDTIIKKQRADIKETDIQPNDLIIVIGSPTDNGEITAKIIRVMPPLPMPTGTTTTSSSTITN